MKFFPLANTTLINAMRSGGVPLSVFLKSLRERRYTPDFLDQIRNMTKFFVTVFNSEGGDMKLTPCEFSHTYKVFNISEDAIIPGFTNKDHNKDGYVDWSECTENALKYFNDSPLNDTSNTWAGPVVACITVVKGDRSKLT